LLIIVNHNDDKYDLGTGQIIGGVKRRLGLCRTFPTRRWWAGV